MGLGRLPDTLAGTVPYIIRVGIHETYTVIVILIILHISRLKHPYILRSSGNQSR